MRGVDGRGGREKKSHSGSLKGYSGWRRSESVARWVPGDRNRRVLLVAQAVCVMGCARDGRMAFALLVHLSRLPGNSGTWSQVAW
jgi:hypothetical protein